MVSVAWAQEPTRTEVTVNTGGVADVNSLARCSGYWWLGDADGAVYRYLGSFDSGLTYDNYKHEIEAPNILNGRYEANVDGLSCDSSGRLWFLSTYGNSHLGSQNASSVLRVVGRLTIGGSGEISEQHFSATLASVSNLSWTSSQVRDMVPTYGLTYTGIAVVGDEVWVVRSDSSSVKRYQVSDDTALDDLTLNDGEAIAYSGTVVYVADDAERRAYAYTSSGVRSLSDEWTVSEGDDGDGFEAMTFHDKALYYTVDGRYWKIALNEPPAWATGGYTYRVSAAAAVDDEVADLSSSLSDPEDDTITCSLATASSYLALSSACVLTVADDLSDLAVLAVTVRATDGTSTVERQVTLVITPVDSASQTGETGLEGTGGVSPAAIRDATVPPADDSSLFGVLVRPTVEVMGLGAGSGAWLSIMVAICAGGLVYRQWPRIEVSSGVGLVVLLTATMAGLMPWWFFGVGTIVQIMGFLMVQSAWDR